MEELTNLIKLVFEILSNAGDSAVGYGFLMILFGSGVVTVIYYVLDFIKNIFKSLLNFFLEGFRAFTEMFKRSPKPVDSINYLTRIDLKIELKKALDEKYKKIDNKLNWLYKKLDGRKGDDKIDDILG